MCRNFTQTRSFVRKWRLPDSADVDAINSRLSDSGLLSVEVPKFQSSSSSSFRRNVPITHTSTPRRETHID
ncbi:hypothetical protein COOONC_15045 [Cooperia oncophora]